MKFNIVQAETWTYSEILAFGIQCKKDYISLEPALLVLGRSRGKGKKERDGELSL